MKQVTILQISEQSKDAHFKMFSSISMLKHLGLKINLEDYKEVWHGDMDIEDAEDVFMKLQGQKPEGYKGHSLSVSDIVIIDGTTFFCDDYGFKDITFSEWGEEAA